MPVLRWLTSPWSRLDALVFTVASGWLAFVLLLCVALGEPAWRFLLLAPALMAAVVTRGCYRLFRTRQHWF